MNLRQTKPWMNEDGKRWEFESCYRCSFCEPSGKHNGRQTCLNPKGTNASSPCPKFDRSDLTESELHTGIGVKIEGRP